MFHLGAYYNAAVAAVANTEVLALQDGIITISNNHFLPAEQMSVIGMYASGLTLQRAYVTSPKIRQINQTYVRPINQALLPANNENVCMLPPGTLSVNGQEEIQLFATCTGAGEHVYGLFWLADQIDPWPIGDMYTCYFSGTATAVASAWTQYAYTLGTALPQGRYAMVMSECQCTTGIAHRWTFDNQFLRPGFLSMASLASRLPYDMYDGVFGKLGEFYTYSLPRLEVLCNAADTAVEGYMTVIRLGDTGPTTYG